MSRRHTAQLMSLVLAVLTTFGMLGGVSHLAGAEARISAAQVALVAQPAAADALQA
jgi:hypothetical protein